MPSQKFLGLLDQIILLLSKHYLIKNCRSYCFILVTGIDMPSSQAEVRSLHSSLLKTGR